MTRLELLRRVHKLSPGIEQLGARTPMGSPLKFRPGSNRSYFNAGGNAQDSKVSLIKKGVIEVAGKLKNGERLFRMTPAGYHEAMKADEWIQNNVNE